MLLINPTTQFLVLGVASLVVADTLSAASLAAQFSLTTRQVLKVSSLPIANPTVALLCLSRPQQEVAAMSKATLLLSGVPENSCYSSPTVI